MCFFWTKVIDEHTRAKEKKKTIDKRRLDFDVTILSMKDTVIEAAERRNDDWAKLVKHRLATVSDLVAADGRYYHDCYIDFGLHPTLTGGKRERPGSDYVAEAMEDIYSYLENDNDCQHSLTDVMSVMSGLVTGQFPEENYIIEINGRSISLALFSLVPRTKRLEAGRYTWNTTHFILRNGGVFLNDSSLSGEDDTQQLEPIIGTAERRKFDPLATVAVVTLQLSAAVNIRLISLGHLNPAQLDDLKELVDAAGTPCQLGRNLETECPFCAVVDFSQE
ncbi:unnamed protein product [Timema podura]|uniref:Uncharacterized protein n=1 Tax=Timema podura TaxID=61482 RepID=A0ABN7NS64_TIMPD|nr:unnamed protein product [Timema podura]